MFGKYTIMLAIMASVGLINLDAIAGEITLPITGHALISNGSGPARILINVPLPQEVNDSNLVFAELTFPITPQLACDSILRIDCYPVTSAWTPQNVGWSSPWQNAGGDYDTSAAPILFAASESSTQQAYFDLTRVIISWLRNTRQNHGLIFMIPTQNLSRFALRTAPNLPTNAIGVLKIVVL
jgi:hypothetical protein